MEGDERPGNREVANVIAQFENNAGGDTVVDHPEDDLPEPPEELRWTAGDLQKGIDNHYISLTTARSIAAVLNIAEPLRDSRSGYSYQDRRAHCAEQYKILMSFFKALPEKRAYWDELRAKAYGRLEATLAGLVYDFGKRKKEEQ